MQMLDHLQKLEEPGAVRGQIGKVLPLWGQFELVNPLQMAAQFCHPFLVKIVTKGGMGAGQGNSILSGGGADLTRKAGQSKQGDGTDPIHKKRTVEAMRAEVAKQDAKRMASLSSKIIAAISNNPKLTHYSSQIRLETTPAGPQIQIVDDPQQPMFVHIRAVHKQYKKSTIR